MTTILRLLTLAAAASAAIIVMGGTDARYLRSGIRRAPRHRFLLWRRDVPLRIRQIAVTI